MEREEHAYINNMSRMHHSDAEAGVSPFRKEKNGRGSSEVRVLGQCHVKQDQALALLVLIH